MSTTSTPSLEVRLAQRERPAERPVMYQRWQDLLFLHWRFDPDLVQSRLPAGLTVDTFDGSAWVGVVPFFMRNIRPWWSPAIPGISNFQELNLRTYAIDEQGTPGVWFLSLDANTRLGVWWGRTFFRLPYVYARMRAATNPQTSAIAYETHRPGTDSRLASHFTYRPDGALRTAEPGSLDFFLVERYVLFAPTNTQKIATGRVHHPPYEFSPAEFTAQAGILAVNEFQNVHRPADHAAVSPGVDVEIFSLKTT